MEFKIRARRWSPQSTLYRVYVGGTKGTEVRAE